MLTKRFLRTLTTDKTREIVKFYYDFKSPYTYLAFEPALKLENDYPIQLRFLPWAFRARESFGGNLDERTRLNWNKVKYLYLDCRRFANERGMIIRGPERLFDSRLSLIGGLYADQNHFFRPYARLTFERFFSRQLNLEDFDEITKILYETSKKNVPFEQFAKDFQNYANTQGEQDRAEAEKEADEDNIFGVPTFVIRGEPFWGYDRLTWVKKRLDALKL
jgi:2-hydroxychromene-2-carboxylate isomerase